MGHVNVHREVTGGEGSDFTMSHVLPEDLLTRGLSPPCSCYMRLLKASIQTDSPVSWSCAERREPLTEAEEEGVHTHRVHAEEPVGDEVGAHDHRLQGHTRDRNR